MSLAIDLALHCKTIVHSEMDKEMKHCESLKKFKRNYHQWPRILRHFHQKPLQIIIAAYMAHSKRNLPALSDKAKSELQRAMKLEVDEYIDMAEKYERDIIEDMPNNNEVIKALHNGLLALGDNVCALEWCSAGRQTESSGNTNTGLDICC